LDSDRKEKELYRRVDEVVHYCWDPIGVSDSAHSRDEYYGYLPTIFSHVKAADLNAILDYMKWVVTDQMGMSFDGDRAKQAAELMLEWKTVIESRNE
jgi:hypothetical protein